MDSALHQNLPSSLVGGRRDARRVVTIVEGRVYRRKLHWEIG